MRPEGLAVNSRVRQGAVRRFENSWRSEGPALLGLSIILALCLWDQSQAGAGPYGP
jgi:hypothetical protein